MQDYFNDSLQFPDYICETYLDMAQALAEDRISLALQPVVSARRNGTEPAISFYEGLLRVISREGEVIPASQFIDAVSGTPLMQELDCAALRCGIALLARHPGLRLSINLSAESLFYAPYSGILQQLIQNDGCQAERLILEITEQSAMTRPVATRNAMDRWRAHGISFALDDFGAGQTSLRHLREFCFDILKVDGDLCRAVDQDPDRAAILRAITDLAAHFEMLCVAEFVSTPMEAACLKEIGVDCFQGYLFGRPELADIAPYASALPLRASA